MVWIHNQNEATSRLYDADLDEEIQFSSNGKAQVSEDVAAQLADRYEAISVAESDDDGE